MNKVQKSRKVIISRTIYQFFLIIINLNVYFTIFKLIFSVYYYVYNYYKFQTLVINITSTMIIFNNRLIIIETMIVNL